MKSIRYISSLLYLLSACSLSAQYSYWNRKADTTAIHLEPRIQLAHMIEDVQLSYDGKYALTWGAGDMTRASLWETSSGKVIRTFDVSCRGATFSEFEPYVIYLESYRPRLSGALINGIEEVWDARSGEKLGVTTSFEGQYRKKKYTNPPYYVKKDDLGHADIYSINTQKHVCQLHSPSIGANGDIILSPDGKYLLFTGKDAFIWDIENACIFAEIPFRQYLHAVPTSKMGWKQWVSGGFIDSRHVWLGAYNGHITQWNIDGTYEGDIPLRANVGWETYLDKETGIRYSGTWLGMQVNDTIVSVPENTYRLLYSIVNVPSENRVYGCGDGGLFYVDKSHPYTLKQAWKPDFGLFCMALSPDGKHLLIGAEGSGVYLYNTGGKDSEYERYSPMYPGIRACAFIDNETFVVGTISSRGTLEYFHIGDKKPFKVVDAHPGGVRAIAVDHTHNVIYSAARDMEFKIWQLDTKELIATVNPLVNSDYIIRTPDGYVKTSPNAAKYIMFGDGMQLYGFEQFEWRYNRPDIIADRLGADKQHVQRLYAAYQKRLRRIGITDDQMIVHAETPSVRLITPSAHAVPSTHQTIEVEMSTPTGSLQAVNIWINGTPIHDVNAPVAKGKRAIKMALTIELAPGENHVEVSCMNSLGVESLREAWDVIVTTPASMQTRWIVSLGVSQYKDATHNLTYPAKDAKDIANLLAITPHNKRMETKVLLLDNARCTSDCLTQIRQWLANAQRQDEIILYYAGHGLLDSHSDYYLSSYDMDFTNPATYGIRYDDIEEILAHTKALNKILLIDACHAGEVDREDLVQFSRNNTISGKVRFRGNNMSLTESMRQAQEVSLLMGNTFADTRRGSGATSFVSASGMEVAIESEEWQNGLFTYVLRQAIEDARADMDHNEEISTNELVQYVILHVRQLSDGAQNPVLRNINYTNNIIFVSAK